MRKTEYFMHQTSYNHGQQALTNVKTLRDNFISSNSIEKIIDESITITAVAGNQVVYMIKLTYY
ncbi:unnamed protein product [Ectocarpus sp. 12 AP-2014]